MWGKRAGGGRAFGASEATKVKLWELGAQEPGLSWCLQVFFVVAV